MMSPQPHRNLKIPLHLALSAPFMLFTVGASGLIGYLFWQHGQPKAQMTLLLSASALLGLLLIALWLTRSIARLQASFDQIKAALQESEEKFTLIFRASPDPIAIVSLEWKYLEVNDAFVQLSEYSRNEIIGRTSAELGFWLNQEERDQYLKLLRAEGRVQNGEVYFHTRSRRHLIMLISIEKVKLQEQTSFVVIAKEVSDRKQLELDLQQSQIRLNDILSSAITAICRFRIDAQGKINYEYFSPSNTAVFGYTPEELTADPLLWRSRLHPDDQENVLATLSPQSNEGSFSTEYRFYHKDGTLRWILDSLKFRRDEHQQNWIVTGVAIDNTAHKQAEEALLNSEERFRSAFQNASIGMALIGLNAYWLKVNPVLCEMLGYAEAELLEMKSATDFVHPDDLDQLKQFVEQARLDKRQSVQIQLRYYCKDRRLSRGMLSLSIVRDSQSQPLYYVVQIQDITEQWAIDQMKNEFISVVSHELRTPLTAIQGCLGLLETGVYDARPEKAKRMLHLALMNSDRLVSLVNDILDLERLDSGRVELIKERCDAQDLIERAVEGVSAIPDQNAVSLLIQPTQLQVWAAPDSIIQTLTNLLSNAIKFSPPNSVVSISVHSQPDTVQFQVKDQGRGIPVDKLETIFGRFQQVDVSDARQKGGTGLGLAICQSIVQQHGGNIWAESILGQGSTFSFTLPKLLERSDE